MAPPPCQPQPSSALSDVSKTCLSVVESRLLDDHRLSDEYCTVRELDCIISSSSSVAPRHKLKNRYNNVHPYDFNRVKLGDIAAEDYINASHVVHEDPTGFCLKYIATQGPTNATIPDFWRMVWEQRVPAVVMVTRLSENRITKCVLYFPSKEDCHLAAGEFDILCTKRVSASSALTIRDFELRRNGSQEVRTVVHYHYRAWPDQGTPEESQPIRQISLELDHLRGADQPILVHCSAGIGRTGTFCAIDILRHRLDALERQVQQQQQQRQQQQPAAPSTCSSDPVPQPHNGVLQHGASGQVYSSSVAPVPAGAVDISALLDVPTLVHALRRQRDGMVQSQEQYSFIYQALFEELQERAAGQPHPAAPRHS